MFGIFDESYDVFDFIAHRNLFSDLDDSVFKAEIAGIDKSVCVDYVPEDAFGDSEMFQYDCVDTVVAGRIPSHNDVGRHILLDSAATLDKRVASDMDILLYDNTAGLDGAVVYLAISGYAHSDTDDAVVVNQNIVTDVYLVHQEVSVTDSRGFAFVYTACNNHIFTDAVIVANGHVGFLPFHIMEILRSSSDDGILIHNIIVAHDGSFEDACMRHNDTIVTDYYILVDIGKGLDLNVFAQFGTWVYIS